MITDVDVHLCFDVLMLRRENIVFNLSAVLGLLV